MVWQELPLMPSLLLLSTLLCLSHTASPSTPRISLSSVWRSVKSHLSSWKRTGSTKFPFLHVEPLRHRMEWREHGTARLVSLRVRPYLHGPAALTLSRLNGLSDCIMTPNRALTGFVFPSLRLWTQYIDVVS